jgi:hypothetical protein
MEAPVENLWVADAHIVDTALVEGAICDTIDLRRSVILKIVYTIGYRKRSGAVKCEDVEDAETATLTVLWGTRRDL